MEATGFYGLALAEYLYAQKYSVSIVNPACIKAYSRSRLSRHKTDKIDAQLIAEYASKQNLKLWHPTSPLLKEIRELYRCLQALKQQLNQVHNHLENKTLPECILQVWRSLKAELKKKIEKIELLATDRLSKDVHLYQDYRNLQTIPGVSKTTAFAMIAEIPDISSFQTARQLAAFAGLTPCHRRSGSSVRGKERLSKMGSPALRKALYFPAIVSKKYNPIIKKFCSNLSMKGKHSMTIIGAAMRKLLHIIFGVLKNKVPFESTALANS